MTVSELKGILSNRIGWKNDRTLDSVISPALSTTSSGRYYQEGHSMITLINIKSAQPQTNISETDFEKYLDEIEVEAIGKVCADVFDSNTVDDKLMALYPTIFD